MSEIDPAEFRAMQARVSAIDKLIAEGRLQVLPEPLPKGPFFSVITTKTCRVRHKKDGDTRVINAEDFNSTEFEKIEDEGPPVAPPRKVLTVPPAKKKLAVMSMEALRALPEYAKIPDGDKIKDKEKLIAAILAVPGQDDEDDKE